LHVAQRWITRRRSFAASQNGRVISFGLGIGLSRASLISHLPNQHAAKGPFPSSLEESN
jgi:hypothetical protein